MSLVSELDDEFRLVGSDAVDAVISTSLALEAAVTAASLVAAGNTTTGRVQVNGPVSWMRILAGMITDLDLLGYKEFHRVGNDVRYHVHLFRESTAFPLGIVDGRRITSLRTAATATAAARHWAGGAEVAVGVIGSGEEAREGLRALAGALDITTVNVFSPTQANREAFAGQMADELALEVSPVTDQAAAIEGADILYVATSSHHQPFLRAADVASVGLVEAIGSTQPVHRELYGDVFAAASQVVVDTPDATHESGDCIEAVADGWDASGAHLLGPWLDGDSGRASGRTVFKSIGSVEQDLVLALYLLSAAKKAGLGAVAEPIGSLRVMR